MKDRLGSWACFLLSFVLISFMASCPFARADQIGISAPNGVPYPVASSEKHSPAAASASAISHEAGKRYFVEFRARNAASYGHLYVLYGEVNARQEIVSSHIDGFFPAGDTRDCENCSVYNWTIGHLIFVPSEYGASDGDLEDRYVLARFRVWLTPDQYRKLVAYIDEKKAHKALWNALWNNCVDFGRDVAETLNLKVPFFVWTTPEDFVTELRKANGVEKAQAPLKDAAGLGAAPANSAAKTPPAAQKPKAQPAATVQPAAAPSRS
jgi:hypothetical protein